MLVKIGILDGTCVLCKLNRSELRNTQLITGVECTSVQLVTCHATHYTGQRTQIHLASVVQLVYIYNQSVH